jgi:hypothetical protein
MTARSMPLGAKLARKAAVATGAGEFETAAENELEGAAQPARLSADEALSAVIIWRRVKWRLFAQNILPLCDQPLARHAPGQCHHHALAYKIGQMRISALRARAEKTLGPRFDLRDFNDAVLATGSVPLQALDISMTAWIAQRQAP